MLISQLWDFHGNRIVGSRNFIIKWKWRGIKRNEKFWSECPD